jgi:hypothetical protein
VRVLSLLLLLAGTGWAAPPPAQWPAEKELDGIVCHADFPLDEQLGLLGEIARLRQDVVKTLQLKTPEEPIQIFLFAKQATYQAYVQHWFPTVGYRRALFIKQDGRGMVFAYQNTELATDLRHESTHAVLHSCLPSVPLWLDEGLAEYFEVPPHKRVHGNPYLVAVKWNARLGAVPPLEELEKLDDMQQMDLREYRHAWAWVHFMLHGPASAREELIAFVGDIARNKPPGKLSQRLADRVDNLQAVAAAHFRSWRR